MTDRQGVRRSGTTPDPDGIAIVDRQLLVGGEPFLILGGELHNSSATTATDLATRWPRLRALGMNTALAAITWELIEPEEGVFDFSTVDALIDGARANDLKLIPLWFGSWKNGLSSYRPGWMKRDSERFPLVQGPDGVRVQVLSAFADSSRQADARAFAAVMAHIRDRDAEQQDATQKTVIMVQVENEVGILGTPRDQTPAALAAWNAPVDPALLDALRKEPGELKPSIAAAATAPTTPTAATWPEVFGDTDDAAELFQAVAYARYVDSVIEAGRGEYELPYFVNTWLDAEETAGGAEFGASGGQRPGVYPSGGPLPQVAAAWLATAPNLTMTTPDIYRGDFADWCRRYADPNVAFFIPEMKKDLSGVGALHVAIGSFAAIGTSPFGIDGDAAEDPAENRELLAGAYAALGSIAPQILAAQRSGQIVGFHLTDDAPEYAAEIGGYRLTIRRDLEDRGVPGIESAWGVVLSDGKGGFLGTGHGFGVTFDAGSEGDRSRIVALERVEAGAFEAGVWRTDQVLNGDETISGEVWRFPYFRPLPGATFGEVFPSPRVLLARVYDF